MVSWSMVCRVYLKGLTKRTCNHLALQRSAAGGLFPAPPIEIFSADNSPREHYDTSNPSHISSSKGSPPGRLLSILFAHMARLRTPPSMMSLWLAFVDNLRSRWDGNESLPNLGFVPGLDVEVIGNRDNTHSLGTSDCRVLGHRAHLAAFVNSSEPDPDRNQCIINQKLQVFNICIETKMSLEAMQDGKNAEHQSMKEDDSNSESDEFFEAEEEEVSFGSESHDDAEIEAMLKNAAASAISGHNRIGARCPVPDVLPLVETGDQVRFKMVLAVDSDMIVGWVDNPNSVYCLLFNSLQVYAPYLQRTLPMTDEEEAKQNKLFGKSNAVYDDTGRLSIRDRIEVSQRLQTPKLMSDMSAFKAANPGCTFEDFVSW